MDVVSFIEKVGNMRVLQKKCYRFCNQALLKKMEIFEKEVDNEIAAYYKGEMEKSQGSLFVDEH